MEKIDVNCQNGSYNIFIDKGFEGLAEALKEIDHEGCKAFIVTDSNVAPLYLESLRSVLRDIFAQVDHYEIKAGEESKNIKTVEDLYSALIDTKYTRSDYIFALGGGVVGDIAGFLAATYKRGLRFVQVPTTLLAMADSSIGGKNGVDYNGYKNMVGSFYNPILIYDNIETLKSLEDRQFANGFAEAMKSAIIKDSNYYEWMIDSMYEINDREDDALIELVSKSASIKKSVVENDPLDKGERALLNLGHTIGHAIEADKIGELLHGECVALGTVAAAFISWKKNMLSMEEYYEIRDMFVPFNLPISVDNIDKDHIIDNISNDKKVDNKGLKFILIKKIGKAVIDASVSKEEIMEALKEIEYSDEF